MPKQRYACASRAFNFHAGQRQALVAELQRQVSEGLLNAELQHMDARGRARAGFSSLWGRFGGIWVNPALSKLSQGMELE